jgi:hypothetical protein
MYKTRLRLDYCQFLFKSEQGDYYLRDLTNNSTYKINYLPSMAHEVTFNRDMFAFICEKSISIVKKNVNIVRIEVDKEYEILKMSFLSNRIVVLYSSKSNPSYSLISMYGA